MTQIDIDPIELLDHCGHTLAVRGKGEDTLQLFCNTCQRCVLEIEKLTFEVCGTTAIDWYTTVKAWSRDEASDLVYDTVRDNVNFVDDNGNVEVTYQDSDVSSVEEA